MLPEEPPEMFCKKGVLRKFAKFRGKYHLCQSLFLIKLQDKACNFIKKETLAQVFSCEFCEISKNTFLQNTSTRLLSYILCEYYVNKVIFISFAFWRIKLPFFSIHLYHIFFFLQDTLLIIRR